MIYAHRAAAILHDVVASHDGVWLLPANVCDIVPATLRAAGRAYELVDVDPVTLEPSREQILSRAPHCAGVVFVRTYGAVYDADAFFAELAREDFRIVDDRCLCPPDVEGTDLSPHADVTLFSTGYAKYVDLGEGGFAQMMEDRQYSLSGTGRIASPPPEYLERVLKERDRADDVKARLNAIYREIIPLEVQMPPELCTWRFNIRVARAEELVRAIFDAGLFASRHYAPLERGFPHAERLHAEVVNLFNDRYFDEEKATRAAELVRRHVTR
ncbi:MAG TPA: hypothetical protein VF266_05560 [Thermoanaerobaculia bacterium]